MSASLLSIGQLATAADVATSTLRYYERLGLLMPACRVGGQRKYRPTAIDRLTVIGFAKSLGFTLDEVATLLKAAGGGKRATRTLRKLSQAKLPEIDAQLDRLALMRSMLLAVQTCGCPSIEHCANAARSLSA